MKSRKYKDTKTLANDLGLSKERVRFELTVRFRTHAFQACAFDHSATSPWEEFNCF